MKSFKNWDIEQQADIDYRPAKRSAAEQAVFMNRMWWTIYPADFERRVVHKAWKDRWIEFR